VFDRFFDNYYFLSVMGVTIILQIIIIFFGADFTSTAVLNSKEWAWCIGFGASSLVTNQIIRLIPINFSDGVVKVDSARLFKKDPEFDIDYDPDEPVQNNIQVVTDTK